ncbi:unnamed protein product [Caenorhabditis bovis]|uniref:Sema domain-containing protein n=1 Tax=Caenorhabditis bovis TaxID=2654633 RepID=A0A8S1FDC9_9PELO|nr:unnamed protein product [Caenorhabditis bovis]
MHPQISVTRQLLFQEDDNLVVLHKSNGYIFLGSSNRAYNVSISDMKVVNTYEWVTSEATRRNCEDISLTISDCNNYIRSFFTLSTRSFLMCGTHGMKPSCAEFNYGQKNPITTKFVVGLAPVSSNGTSPFHQSGQNIITATVPDLASSEPFLLRRKIRDIWREDDEENANILRTPRGLGTFEQAEILSMHKNRQELTMFFTETPVISEECGHRVVPRVARVCIDDQGGRGNYKSEWSSFVKARVECVLEEDGADTFHYNQLKSISETHQNFYGAFRSELAGIGASAICKYSKQEISQSLSSAFHSIRSDQCSKANDFDELSRLRLNPLIKKRIKSHPIFSYYGKGKEKFIYVLPQEQVRDLSNQTHDILFIATNFGNILKIIISNGNARHSSTFKVLPVNTKVISMFLTDENHFAIVTENSIVKMPTSVCMTSNEMTCALCLQAGDPQCAWKGGVECLDITRTYPEGLKYLTQETAHCPKYDDRLPVKNAPIIIEAEHPICLCESSSIMPSTTEVIQKEIINDSPGPFFYGMLLGTIVTMLVFALVHLIDKPMHDLLTTNEKTLTGEKQEIEKPLSENKEVIVYDVQVQKEY